MSIPTDKKIAVITGASSGIGAATADTLAANGWHVVVAARRKERLDEVAEKTGGTAIELDVTDQGSVDAFAEQLPRVDLLVNNAGGALGLDHVRDANLDDWQAMYDTNVLGVVRVTKALLPKLLDAENGEGLIINIGSMAAWNAYPGGAGYNAAKFGLRALTRAMRQEEKDNPLRITELDPGRVATDFSLVRFKGDHNKADAVYADKLNLTAEDIAEAVRWIASLPAHMNIDTINIMPRDQA